MDSRRKTTLKQGGLFQVNECLVRLGKYLRSYPGKGALMVNLPTSRELNDALLAVLAKAPNGMTTAEMDLAVANLLGLSQEQRTHLRSGSRTELSYRLAWERTHAKKAGKISRVGTRTWKLENPSAGQSA